MPDKTKADAKDETTKTDVHVDVKVDPKVPGWVGDEIESANDRLARLAREAANAPMAKSQFENPPVI